MEKQTFKALMNLIIDEEKKADGLEEALQKYTGDTEFTGFYSQLPWQIVDIIEDVFKCPDLVSWWLWDLPEQGKNKKYAYIEYKDKKYQLYTLDALYDFLVLQSEHVAYSHGLQDTWHLVHGLRTKNMDTKNSGWEERETLLKMVEHGIENTHIAHTGREL